MADQAPERSQGPGNDLQIQQPKMVLLIFVSGKVVLTGAKVRDETYRAFENIYPVLTQFRKTPTRLLWIQDAAATADQEKRLQEASLPYTPPPSQLHES